jgi:hypothetical protein
MTEHERSLMTNALGIISEVLENAEIKERGERNHERLVDEAEKRGYEKGKIDGNAAMLQSLQLEQDFGGKQSVAVIELSNVLQRIRAALKIEPDFSLRERVSDILDAYYKMVRDRTRTPVAVPQKDGIEQLRAELDKSRDARIEAAKAAKQCL